MNTVKNLKGEKLWLFGDILNSPVSDLLTDPGYRAVQTQDKERFINNLCGPDNYPHLRVKIESFMRDDRNFSVCYKTESEGHLPWIFETNRLAPEFRNIYIAGPGKATLAYYTAYDLLRRSNLIIETESNQPRIAILQSEIRTWSETN